MNLGLGLGLGVKQAGGGGSPAPFAPTDISGLELWLDASDTSTITHVGGAVSQVDNKKTGGGTNAVQATGSRQPTTGTHTINGLNTIKHDGVDDTLAIASSLNSIAAGDNTFFLIGNGMQGDNQFCNNGGASSFRIGIRDAALDTTLFIHRNSFQANATIQRPDDTGVNILGWRRSGSSFDVFSHAALTNFTNAQDRSDSQFNIGADQNGNAASGMNWGEIIWYSKQLSLSEMNQVGNYLATRWGITWTDIT